MIIKNSMLANQSKGSFSTGDVTHNGVSISTNGKLIGYVKAEEPMIGQTDNILGAFDSTACFIGVNLPSTTDIEVIGIKMVNYLRKNRKR